MIGPVAVPVVGQMTPLFTELKSQHEFAHSIAVAIAELQRELAVLGAPKALARAAASIPGIVSGKVTIVDQDAELLVPVATFGRDMGGFSSRVVPLDPDNPDGSGPCGMAVRTGMPVVMALNDARLGPQRDDAERLGLASVAVLPLTRADGTALGALTCWAEDAAFFDDFRMELLRAFAQAGALTFEVARLRELLSGGGGQDPELAAQNTALARRNEQLLEAARLKSEFLADMSHELRSPLTGIIGFAEVLREELYGPLNERQKEYASLIWESGKRLLTLLEEVLDLSRLEAGKTQLDMTDNYPRQVAESVVVLLQQAAFERGVRLDWVVAQSAETPVMMDARKVKQILFHLLSAAIKRSSQGGVVTLEVEASEEHLKFCVRDTAPALVIGPDMFKAFARIDVEGGGRERSGVGLAFAAALAELLGGRLQAGPAPGKGNVFTLSLPAPRA